MNNMKKGQLILIDLKEELLEEKGITKSKAETLVTEYLQNQGFSKIMDFVYRSYDGDGITSVTSVVSLQELDRRYDWFGHSVVRLELLDTITQASVIVALPSQKKI